jgi:hypothetical protein
VPTIAGESWDLASRTYVRYAPALGSGIESPRGRKEHLVERFATASIDDFERLVERAASGDADVEAATYPPGCNPPLGALRFRRLDVGGLMVEVDRRELEIDDFRLGVLFYSGSCVFTGPADLMEFFRGAVAAAFGITVEPLPQRATDALVEDLRPRALLDRRPAPATPRKGRARCTAPASRDLERRLATIVRGQDSAVRRIADVVSAHLAKTAPARPETLLLIGPTGTGKTSAIESLPNALRDAGSTGAHVFRVDCNELTDDHDLRRFLGAAPGFVGYSDEPPFLEALKRPRCIVLLDEVEKAHAAVRTVFLGLLDEGRVTAPDGTSVRARDAIVAMTTNLGVDDLRYALRDVPDHDRWRQRVCREHLLANGWAPELVGRIGDFAVFDPLGDESIREVAEDAIHALGREYGLDVEAMSPVLLDVVLELAGESEIGARAFTYAARELLGQPFAEAARDGLEGPVSLDAGPPPKVVVASPCLL